MENKTCGECKHYIAMNRCVLLSKFVQDDDFCGGYLPKLQPLTNGDVIRQGGNKALIEYYNTHECDICAYYNTYMCNTAQCEEGKEAWLDQEAE